MELLYPNPANYSVWLGVEILGRAPKDITRRELNGRCDVLWLTFGVTDALEPHAVRRGLFNCVIERTDEPTSLHASVTNSLPSLLKASPPPSASGVPVEVTAASGAPVDGSNGKILLNTPFTPLATLDDTHSHKDMLWSLYAPGG